MKSSSSMIIFPSINKSSIFYKNGNNNNHFKDPSSNRLLLKGNNETSTSKNQNIYKALKNSKSSKCFYKGNNNNNELAKYEKKINDFKKKINASTDDKFFALSEINHIDNQILKREKSKNHVWELDYSNKIYDLIASQNTQDLKNIKNKVKYDDNSEFDLRAEIDKKKYFSLDNVDNILECEKIIKRLKIPVKQVDSSYKKYTSQARLDLVQFANHNREICLKNFLIGILKDQRKNLKDKEINIGTSLKQAQDSYAKDLSLFSDYLEKKKKAFREIEIKLTYEIRVNKELMEVKKRLSQDYKVIQDQIEKTICDIILYKKYADFVHKISHTENEISNAVIGTINFINFGKNIEQITKHIIDQFEFLLKDNYPMPNILSQPSSINDTFLYLEQIILKGLEDLEDTNDANYNEILNEGNEINKLKDKKIIYEKEKEKIIKELNDRDNIIGQGKEIFQQQIDMYSVYIEDLYEAISEKNIKNHPVYELVYKELYDGENNNNKNEDENNNTNYNKISRQMTKRISRKSLINNNSLNNSINEKGRQTTDNLMNNNNKNESTNMIKLNFINQILKEALDILNEKENIVIDYISEIEKIETLNGNVHENMIFKRIINRARNENRVAKYKEAKKLQDKLEEERKIKLQQREFRFKIKGPIAFPPPNVINKKKKKNEDKEKSLNNDNDMLEYY